MTYFAFQQTSYCKFCKDWLQKNPLPFYPKQLPSYNEQWEKADQAETKREEATDPNRKPPEGIVVLGMTTKKDTSMRTGYAVMALCGFFGLLAGGISTAIAAGMFGFGATALVFALQDGTKDL